MKLDELKATLSKHDQLQVLQYWDELTDVQRGRLVGQLESIDFDQLAVLVAGDDEKPDFTAMADRATPPPAVGSDGAGVDWSINDARSAGEEALRAGKLGALLVAGGQGTRLGFDQPKGMYPIGPVSGRTLFQLFADRLKATSERYDVVIPLYVMTSDATDAETREFFDANNYLGLPKESVMIFRQGTMPAVDQSTGKLLLASKDSLALSPDGHGGTVKAFVQSGCMADAQKRGVEQLFYFQVDNPLVQLMDPELIGHHLKAKSELTTQVVRKRYPTERVGNVVTVDGRLRIIEYSDLPESVAQRTNEDGSLTLWAGNIAVHVFELDFLDRASESVTALPFHRASKKVVHLDTAGKAVEPEAPNATKFEKFIFDLLPIAERGFVVEAEPAEAFAPVKNAAGAANDTAELAKQAISALHGEWLRSAGATLTAGTAVEISPLCALDAEDLATQVTRTGKAIDISDDRFFDGPLE